MLPGSFPPEAVGAAAAVGVFLVMVMVGMARQEL
jgi:hypothetical protein